MPAYDFVHIRGEERSPVGKRSRLIFIGRCSPIRCWRPARKMAMKLSTQLGPLRSHHTEVSVFQLLSSNNFNNNQPLLHKVNTINLISEYEDNHCTSCSEVRPTNHKHQGSQPPDFRASKHHTSSQQSLRDSVHPHPVCMLIALQQLR
jgi:hypothetical protein